jgi:hypothetical protein
MPTKRERVRAFQLFFVTERRQPRANLRAGNRARIASIEFSLCRGSFFGAALTGEEWRDIAASHFTVICINSDGGENGVEPVFLRFHSRTSFSVV